MCPTATGRLHTRTAGIITAAIFALIVSLITWHFDWLALVGLYFVMGVVLDWTVYSWLFRFQPPWMTLVIALSELGFLLVLSRALAEQGGAGGLAHISILEAIVFFWCCWLLAVPVTKVVLLPLISLTYLESAG